MERKRVIVIGGGAAGLMAAISAAERGASVTLLEPNERLGKKLNITGKGRCNVTNDADRETVLSAVTRNAKFLYSALSAFGPRDAMAFFESLGVPLKVERGRRVFPVSDSAFDVSAALERRLKALRVSVIRDRAVSVMTADNAADAGRAATADNAADAGRAATANHGTRKRVTGVTGERGAYPADAVILATGGVSYPATGSTGEGHRIAQELGHTVTPLQGSLVPLRERGNRCARMRGLSLRNIGLTAFEDDKKIYQGFGELLFTHFGVSGPLILTASAHMRRFEQCRYRLEIDLKPALDFDALNQRLLSDFKKRPNSDFSNAFNDLLPRKLIPIFVEDSGIPPETKVNAVTRPQRLELLRLLKAFPIEIAGARPITEAVVTSGGVNVAEVSPKTMESRKIGGLHFAGELLDVDAYTGGYNLQIAWSTGRAAGIAAAQCRTAQ